MKPMVVTGVVKAVTELDRFGGVFDACKLRIGVDWTVAEGHINAIDVWCTGQDASTAIEQLTVGDDVELAGWLTLLPLAVRPGRQQRHLDVVLDHFESLGPHRRTDDSPDAHLEAAYDDRQQLDEGL